MTTVALIVPTGTSGLVQTPNGTAGIASDGTMSVDVRDIPALLAAGFRFYRQNSISHHVEAPLPADLVSVKAAATPANGTITIAAQPPHARKLQVRVVVGTPGTTDIAAGTLTLVGVDQDGNAITEVISLVAGTSVTLKTAYAYAKLTSGTVANYAANGGGTGNTLGIGVSNDFGIPGGSGAGNMSLVKATKVTKVLGTSVTAADDAAGSATVDSVARTVAPTTAPSASGLIDYVFHVSFGIAD
jgi:hypothetical protein